MNGVGLRSRIVQASFVVTGGLQQNNGSLVLLRSGRCAIQSCLGHCSCAARGDLCTLPSPPPLSPCTELPPSSLPQDRILRVFNIAPQQATPTPHPLFTSMTDILYGGWELADSSSTAVRRLEWSVGLRDHPAGPGAGLMDPSTDQVWRDASSAESAAFRVSAEFPLVEGEAYVFYVRAWYGQNEFAVFVSEGVVVDTQGPLALRGFSVREGPAQSRDLDLSSTPSMLSVAWDDVFSSRLSGNFSTVEVGVGRVPGSDDLYPLTSVPVGEVEVRLLGLSLEEGVAYYSVARATNPLGASVTSISDGIVIDATPPDVGVVVGGRGSGYRGIVAQESTDTFLMRWFGFEDADSAIHHYEVAVTNTTATPPSHLYTDVGIRLEVNVSGLSLAPGSTHYGHVVAVNGAGLRSRDVVSGGVAVQNQRPEGRACQRRSAEMLTNPSFDANTSTTSPCPATPISVTTATYGWGLDTSYIAVAAYSEATPTLSETPPIDGCFAIGFIGSISQTFPTLPGHAHLLSLSYRYLPLPLRGALRVQISGIDRLLFHPARFGGWSTAHVTFVPEMALTQLVLSSALSDTVVYVDHVTVTRCDEDVSLVSSSLSETWPMAIHLSHQVVSSSKVRLSARWGVVDEVGGVGEYQWAVGTTPGGGQLLEYTSTGPTPHATSPELLVLDTQTLHVSVLATSHTGKQKLVHSGPYLVDLTPPYAGEGPGVWDGVGETDVDYQSSAVVGVNWSGMVDQESQLQVCSWAIGESNSQYLQRTP